MTHFVTYKKCFRLCQSNVYYLRINFSKISYSRKKTRVGLDVRCTALAILYFQMSAGHYIGFSLTNSSTIQHSDPNKPT